MIEVKNLVKRYGEHIAVNNLSFTVEKGQIYGFLGPNGAGKSTTMNIMTGYIASTEGEVYINGYNILEEPEEAKKCIGYLPEMPPLYMDMTVQEYLQFAAELKNIEKSKRTEMINEAIKATKLESVRKRLIKNISKGFKQRVGLAQAILGFPEIIILDEPTVGLDPKQIIEIRDLIKELSAKHTIILSSHILSEVSAVCDHIVIIAHGKLVASDTPNNLSKLMAGSNSLELTVRGRKEQVRSILKKIKSVKEIEIHNSVEPNCVDISLKTTDGRDIREEIFYAFATEKCAILMMKSSNMSLEDVFLELTSDVKADEYKRKRHFARTTEKGSTKTADISVDTSTEEEIDDIEADDDIEVDTAEDNAEMFENIEDKAVSTEKEKVQSNRKKANRNKKEEAREGKEDVGDL